MTSSSVDISESFKGSNDIKYHLTVITCLIGQFEVILKKNGEKSPQTTICKKRHKISLALLNFCCLKPINPCTCFRCDALLYVDLSYSDSIAWNFFISAWGGGRPTNIFIYIRFYSFDTWTVHAIVHYHCYLGYMVIVIVMLMP